MTEDILSSILSPEDLKKLTIEQLETLSTEIRKKIISVLSVNGGHLASNLGTIELTIALHYVFNSPKDTLIWDVSHQTYTHKLLTGRQKEFPTIRKYKGVSGFSHPKESPHDHFFAGHAGTALSLGLGVAKKRDLIDDDHFVLPIIGDATLTCGVSLEALNNISRDMKKFIVILNDNNMSISKNVGAITHILSRLINNPTTNRLYQELDTFVSKIPAFGQSLSKQGHKIAESLKNLVSPASFFEQYGLAYVGPFDGHNIKDLVNVLEGIKDSSWPVLLHVHTNKGQGMEMAIQNPVSYHGARPFCIDTGKFLPAVSIKPTFPKIFGDHIVKLADQDPRVVVVTPAMSAGSCLDELMKKYPDRCMDVGIAESHAVTFCGGLAYKGNLKVVACIYSTFLQRGFDNLFHDVCLQEIPVVFAIDRGGLAGADGATHNGIYDISFLNAMPNMVIAQPRNGKVLRELFNSAFSWERPTAIRYPNIPTEDESENLQYRTLGQAEVLSEGTDLLIIGLGHMSNTALALKELLSAQNISATVLDPIFVKPLDTEMLCKLLVDHKKIVTIEEHSLKTGLGSIINHYLLSNGFNDIEVMNFGIPEAYIEHGTHNDLLKELGLTAAQLAPQILKRYYSEVITPC